MSKVSRNNFSKLAKLVPRLEFLRKSALTNGKSAFEVTSLQDHNEFTYEWTVSVLRSNIRSQLLQPLGHFADIENAFCDTKLEKLSQYFENRPSLELNQAFLWAAFSGSLDGLKKLHQFGADIQYSDIHIQLNALHLAAFVGSAECCEWLLAQKSADLRRKTDDGLSPLHYAVLGGSRKVAEYFIANGCELTDAVLNLAVYSNSVQCLELMVLRGLDVNAYHRGMTALHNAVELNHKQCLEYLLKVPSIRIDLKSEDTNYTALHFAAENGYTEMVELLISRGARVTDRNKKQQSALHLACKMQHLDTVECLLKNGADIDAADADLRTPLHHSLCADEVSAVLVVDMLIKHKANVNASDRYNYTPLHIAAINEMASCTNMLILNGANAAAKTKGGVTALHMIKRKMPACVDSIKKKFTNSLAYTIDENVKFNFRDLLVNTTIGETDYLYTLQEEGETEILKHPLCRAFLVLKWRNVKPFYVLRIFLSLVAVIAVNFYIFSQVIQEDCCYFQKIGGDVPLNEINVPHSDLIICNITVENTDLIANACIRYFYFREAVKLVLPIYTNCTIIWIIIAGFLCFYSVRLLLTLPCYGSFRKFLNLLEILEFAIVAHLCIYYIQIVGSGNASNHAYFWQRVNGVLIVFLSWMHLLVLNGQLFFRTYFAMFKKVTYESLKLLFVYFYLLFGFTCTFCILFLNVFPNFDNPIIGLVKVFAMMTGEIEFSDVMEKINATFIRGMVLVFLGLFIALITFVLMNLMVGIAVSDVDGLRKTADLAKLVQQTQAIYFVEVACLNGLLPRRMKRFCRRLLFVWPDSYRKAIYVRATYQGEQVLPRDIINDGLELALWRRREAAEKEGKSEEEAFELLNKFDLMSKRVERSLRKEEKLLEHVDEKIKTLDERIEKFIDRL